MKKVLFLTILTVLLTVVCEAGKIDGRIVLSDGQEMSVVIKVKTSLFGKINFIALQKKVIYYKNGKKHKLSPDDVKKVYFDHKGESVVMVSVKDNLNLNSIFSGDENILLREVRDGDVQLFKYYYKQHSPGAYNGATGAVSAGYSYNIESYILRKKEGGLKRPRAISFKSDMSEYFSDCPALSDKISNKEFRARDIELIVNFYNRQCD